MADVSQGPNLDILSDEFAEHAAAAGDRACRSALILRELIETPAA